MKVLAGLLLFMPAGFSNLFACSVCFGNPNSLQSKALSGAVLFLLVTIGGILTAVAGLAFTWARRAKKLAETSA